MSHFFDRYLPMLTVGAALAYLAAAMIPHADRPDDEQLQQFGKLPVQYGGRMQPIDSVARNSLMIISGRQTFRDENEKSQPAVRWLLDVMSSRMHLNRAIADANWIRVESPDVQKILGVPPKSTPVYNVSEFQRDRDRFIEFLRLGMRAENTSAARRSEFDHEILDVVKQLKNLIKLQKLPAEDLGVCGKYPVFRIENDQLLGSLGLSQRSGLRYGSGEFAARYEESGLDEAAKRAGDKEAKDRDAYDVKLLDLQLHLKLYRELAHQMKPQAVISEQSPGAWKSLAELRGDEADESNAVAFNRMLLAHADKKPDQFNAALAAYAESVKQQAPTAVKQAKVEAFFNHVEPFYHCMVLYVGVFLLAFVGFAFRYDALNRAAFWLAVLTLALHTAALAARMYISGRPPVTNLYSSAVFIGWGCLFLALVLEAYYRNGIGNVVGSVMGFSTVLIAHHLLATNGDTLEMLQAVLDTNFWLATHVVCVTMGYTATFVAGALGILFVLLGVCTPRLDKALFISLSQMIYGVVCFATLLSFVGTVLGGIWADQSWGRFWGWDPKENGALLIVIWNALILHARWGGMVKQRGMAVLTIVGNMVTLWSWFGTNQLSVGLHAYGFSNALAATLTVAWGVHIILIGVGLLPTKYWWSFATEAKEPPPPTRRRGGRPEPQPV
jgi:ABC-type transport system involved in cytochrome c biogenesis permease subunit